VSLPARKGRGEQTEPDPPIFQRFSRRRMNPCATSGGDAWRRRATTVPTVPGALHNPFLES